NKVSNKARWAGRIITGLAVAFLVFDIVIKLLSTRVGVESTVALGFPAGSVWVIGLIELFCLGAYLVPRSAILGAVLMTGYLGGAIATHLRLSDPVFSHTLFPVYVAAMIWGGLYLRDRRVGVLVPTA